MSRLPPLRNSERLIKAGQQIARRTAGYLAQRGEQIYYTLPTPTEFVRANVVVAGPFASERNAVYSHCTRWSECLTERGFQVLRFDYRGHGESTGPFEEQGFSKWCEDIEICARWFCEEGPDVPLVLQGLRMGALLADDVFHRGLGDALLLWDPSTSAREILYRTPRVRLGTNSAQSGERKTRDDYVAELEAGHSIEVDCYRWTKRVWQESADLVLYDLPSQRRYRRSRDVASVLPWPRFSKTSRLAGC